MNTEKKSPTKYRENSCQIHLEIPIDFNNKINEIAKSQMMTKASYMVSLLKNDIEGNGTYSIQRKLEEQDKKIDKINDKLDTVINLISKL